MELGWVRVPNRIACLFIEKQGLFLSVYVDEIKIVCIPTCHRTRDSQLVWRITVSRCKTPSQRTSSQTRLQAETRCQETHQPHGQGWRSCLRVHPGLCGTLVGPGKDTVHPCLYGGRPWVAQDTLHATPAKRQDQGLQRHALVTNNNGWKDAEHGSHVEEMNEEMWILTNQLHFSTTYIWDALNVNASRNEIIIDEHRKMFKSRIAAAATEKITRCETPHAKMVAWSYDMEGHAQKMR